MAPRLNSLRVTAKIDNRKKELVEELRKNTLKAGLMLQAFSQRIVPVHTGVLKSSAYTTPVKIPYRPNAVAVEVGYTQDYALVVHENLNNAHGKEFNVKHAEKIAKYNNKHPYWFERGPKQQAKYLEAPLRDHQNELKQTMLGRFGSE